MKMPEHKNFMEELQSLDQAMKRRVLVAGTAIIMVIVIYFWLAYFNNMVANLSTPAVAQTTSGQTAAAPQTQAAMVQSEAGSQTNSSAQASSPTIWQNVTGGTAFIVREFGNMMNGLAHILQTPRQYIVHPPK